MWIGAKFREPKTGKVYTVKHLGNGHALGRRYINLLLTREIHTISIKCQEFYDIYEGKHPNIPKPKWGPYVALGK
jgi:hypothetical protein